MIIKMCKVVCIIFVYCIFLLPNETFAETENIEAVGVYVVGDGMDESPKLAKERAKKEAMRIALDKAGIYVESFSEMKNFRLTKDEIKIIAGEIITVENESYDVEILSDEVIKYTATIQAVIDTDVIATKIKQLEESGGNFSDEAQRLRKENEKIKNDYAKLNEEISSDNSEAAEQYLTEGNDALKVGDYQKAIDCFSKVIDFQNDYTDAWYLRAKAYDLAGQYKAALSDYTQLIELTAQSADAFYLRGTIHEKLGDRDNALKDFDRALEKAPKDKRTIRARERLLAGRNK
ncbi:MAG: tetratricopeptide repeat protein [Quinella sp. 3Q1]|nr:tetratricopeptide repeat protein [Quinella sp. 3Q1]MBR6887175.1 tetratricopeptide repeat protein [Selenomonadaceae bacterium]